MIEAVQPSTSMQERKAYPWGCPYHSCRGPFQRGLPPHRSFSGPHRGFSHGPSYRPPLRPPVRRNIATNPYVKPRSRPHRNDNRNFNDFTPPSGNFTPHPPASEPRYYQKFSQALPNKMEPPAVLDYRTGEKETQTHKKKKPPLSRYPEWQREAPPFKNGQMVCLLCGGGHYIRFCRHSSNVPPKKTLVPSYDSSIENEISLLDHQINQQGSRINDVILFFKEEKNNHFEKGSVYDLLIQTCQNSYKELEAFQKNVRNLRRKSFISIRRPNMAYSQSTWGSYIQKLQDINEEHIAAISRLAIQHFRYPVGVVKAILKEFLEKLLSEALEEEKDLQSLRSFNYMLGLQHCFALERTITRKQFFIDHLGTTFNNINKLDNQAISTLKENLEDLTLIKYRIEEKLGSLPESLHNAEDSKLQDALFFISSMTEIYFSQSEAGKSQIQVWQNHLQRIVNESGLVLEQVISDLEKKYKKLKTLQHSDSDVSLKIMTEKNTTLTDLVSLGHWDPEDPPPFYIHDPKEPYSALMNYYRLCQKNLHQQRNKILENPFHQWGSSKHLFLDQYFSTLLRDINLDLLLFEIRCSDLSSYSKNGPSKFQALDVRQNFLLKYCPLTISALETPIEEIWDDYNFVFHYRIRALLPRILKKEKDAFYKDSIKEEPKTGQDKLSSSPGLSPVFNHHDCVIILSPTPN